MAKDLHLIGVHDPAQLRGRNPRELYDALCERTHIRQDPCVLDVFISIVHFIDGGDPRPWWTFTEERKRLYRRERGNG